MTTRRLAKSYLDFPVEFPHPDRDDEIPRPPSVDRRGVLPGVPAGRREDQGGPGGPQQQRPAPSPTEERGEEGSDPRGPLQSTIKGIIGGFFGASMQSLHGAGKREARDHAAVPPERKKNSRSSSSRPSIRPRRSRRFPV